MLSSVSQTSLLGCSLQLARALAPFAGSLLTRRGYTAQAELAAQVPTQGGEASSFPRFNPDSQPQLPQQGAVLASHHPSQRFCSVLGFVRCGCELLVPGPPSLPPRPSWFVATNYLPKRKPSCLQVSVSRHGLGQGCQPLC